MVDLAQGMVNSTSIVPVPEGKGLFLHVSYFWVKPLWRERLAFDSRDKQLARIINMFFDMTPNIIYIFKLKAGVKISIK